MTVHREPAEDKVTAKKEKSLSGSGHQNPHSITGSKSRQSQVEEGEKEREEKTEKERV